MVDGPVEPAVSRRTVGVEEEFILVGASSHEPSAIGSRLVDVADEPGIKGEFKEEQVEVASSPAASLDDLAADLGQLRRRLVQVAADHDTAVVATGTWPGAHDPTPVRSVRFDRINDEFGNLARQQLTCGTHVHVSVDSPSEGVHVLDRIRPWLSVLTALTANSPFWQGRDSGCASWRSVVLSQLPTAGPAPVWGDLETYRRTVREVVRTGGAFDEGMLYYDARLSARFPTVEVRVTDVCPDVEVAVAVAALCRALVDTAATSDPRMGPPEVSTLALRAAAWRAARHGVGGMLVDPTTNDLSPAAPAVESLLAHTEGALEDNGDSARVREVVGRILTDGTFADRQRRLVDPTGPGRAMGAFRVL
ncbi:MULTISPECIES: carboxylate-amine ligase [unclassified Knoellia]|uniref:carboxylate-amine ligase n=1 Tax=Knoellia altitudinis TaxID=3404795 RepID=UPI00361A9CE7